MKKKRPLTAKERRSPGLPLKLSLAPQRLTTDSWYYEERKGLRIVYWHSLPNGTREAIHLTIPVKKIEASMRRYRAERAARA